MNDMASVIQPKVDQLTADHLIAGPITITITGVHIAGGAEQPVTINYAGDNGLPYKPCKTMCRVMVALWGDDANKYIGKSMTLYRDATVKWAGLEVGGVRISHMSGLPGKHTMALTQTKGSKKPFTVLPLEVQAPKRTIGDAINELEAAFAAAATRDAVDAVLASDKCQKTLDYARNGAKERLNGIIAAAMKRTEQPPPPAQSDDPAADEAAELRALVPHLVDRAAVDQFAAQHRDTMVRWKKERPELFESVDSALAERLFELE